MKLYVDWESNPELKSILDKYNDLMDEWNEVNESVLRFPRYSIYWYTREKRLLSIGYKVAAYQAKWVSHNAFARSFAINPILRYPLDVDETLVFQHVSNLLLNRIDQFQFNMSVLESSYNLKHSELMWTLNFNVAIVSFVLGFVSFLGMLASAFL